MSKEKMLKLQAKNMLKGNWGTIIAATLFVCTVFYLIVNLMYALDFFLEIIDIETGMPVEGKTLFFVLVTFVFSLIAFAASPLINGIYKMFFKISCCGKTEITDVFYCFKNAKLYTKALKLNLVSFALFFIASNSLNIYNWMLLAFNTDEPSVIERTVLIVCAVVTVAIILLLYLIFVNYAMFAFAADDSKSVRSYTLNINYLGKSLRLLLSFSGWVALCFFVVPAFYVFPYMMTTFATSAKWLFTLEHQRSIAQNI